MKTWLSLFFCLGVMAVAACGDHEARVPVPEDQIEAARPYGISPPGTASGLRLWGDSLGVDDPALLAQRYGERLGRIYAAEDRLGDRVEIDALSLSGGGPDGAFGAGVLKGWTARGDRPEFEIVTGISTGAIVALFAFLGPEYDDQLEEIYTQYTTDDILTETILTGIAGGVALSDTAPYRELIEKYLTDQIVAELAEAYSHGRTLLIGTTNLDAARPVVWRVGAIAATGHLDARQLIIDIIQASSAIPGAFPPVIIPVHAPDGRVYDEMHVDGGATQQVTLYSPEISLKTVDKAIGVPVDREVWIIMNNKLQKPYAPVEQGLLSIAKASFSSLIGGSGGADLYKIFAIAQRDNIKLNMTWIPKEFDVETKEIFDPEYMRELYNLGYEYGRSGENWSPIPPDFLTVE